MDLERWKRVGLFFAGIAVGILVTVVWAQGRLWEGLDDRVAELEAVRLHAAQRREGFTQEPGPGAQLVDDAQARLEAVLARAGPAPVPGNGCEAPAAAGEGAPAGSAGSVSAAEWLRRQGAGS